MDANANNWEKQRAKNLLIEIVRQAGGEIRSKTRVFKAFWKAQVEFAKGHMRGLSTWPIVRMPNGPGIDNFDVLIGELMAEKVVSTSEFSAGKFTGLAIALINGGPALTWTNDELEAINLGVAYIRNKTAAEASSASHADSRAWQSASDGEPLDVVIDTMPEEELEERQKAFSELRAKFAVKTA